MTVEATAVYSENLTVTLGKSKLVYVNIMVIYFSSNSI